jgi:hypothetical protein
MPPKKRSNRHTCGGWPRCAPPCPVYKEELRAALGEEHPPAVRWQQFERSVLEHLRAARESLASASGMAMSDGMIKWSGDARDLAARIRTLVKEIEENRDRVLRESCR